MKNNNKLYILLGCFFFIFLTYEIMDSYGIFESNIVSDAESSLSKWQILINESEITGETNTFTIDEVFWLPNTGVVSGKAAPGLSGYFEIIIDPTGSEVSIEYEITLDFLNLGNDMIYITSVEDEDQTPLTLIDTNKYYGMIPLSEIVLNEVKTIKVELTWENDEGNNEVDSSYIGSSNPFLDIPISIKLSQYIG